MNLNLQELKKYKPYYFGLGFIQLKLNDTERLHFYHPEVLPILDEEEIHNHRYDFTSKILLGCLKQDIFFPAYRHAITEPVYGVYNVSCKQSDAGKPATFSHYCEPKKLASFETNRDGEYSITKHAFHRVKIEEPTITYLKRESPSSLYAEIVRKIDTPDVCPFSKKMEEDEIWSIIEDVMKGCNNK